MKYRDPAGFVALRVTTDVREQTDSKERALRESDLYVLCRFVVQNVSQLQLRGKFGSVERILFRTRSNFARRNSLEDRFMLQILHRLIDENRRKFKSVTHEKVGRSTFRDSKVAGTVRSFEDMDLSAGGYSRDRRSNREPATGPARGAAGVSGKRSKSVPRETAADKEPFDLSEEKARQLISDIEAVQIFESSKWIYF